MCRSPRHGERVVNIRDELTVGLPALEGSAPVEWLIADRPIAYAQALAVMEARVEQIAAGTAPELVWLLEHPPLYTAGTSADRADVLDARFPVFEAGCGA